MSRNLLHRNKLNDFKLWMVERGYTSVALKGSYEVARFTHTTLPVVVIFTRAGEPDHLSILDKDADLVRAFLRKPISSSAVADRANALRIFKGEVTDKIPDYEDCSHDYQVELSFTVEEIAIILRSLK